jgi:hypothetical protein
VNYTGTPGNDHCHEDNQNKSPSTRCAIASGFARFLNVLTDFFAHNMQAQVQIQQKQKKNLKQILPLIWQFRRALVSTLVVDVLVLF